MKMATSSSSAAADDYIEPPNGATPQRPRSPLTTYQTPYGTVEAPSLAAAQKFIANEKAKRAGGTSDVMDRLLTMTGTVPSRETDIQQGQLEAAIGRAGRAPMVSVEQNPQGRNLASRLVPFFVNAVMGGDTPLSEMAGEAANLIPGFEGRVADIAGTVTPYIAGETPGRIPGGLNRGRVFAPPALTQGGAVAGRAERMNERARLLLSGKFEQGVEGGAPTAMDTISELTRARAARQPMTLLDVPSQPVQKLASRIYRRGGAGASQIRSFMEGREAGSMGRTERLINTRISDQPLSTTAEELAQQRSEHAAPIWAEVKRGGSTAPLATQFEQAFQESLKEKEAALQAVRSARVRATQAAARRSQAGNVYASSASNAAQRTADAQLKTAMDNLEVVTKRSEDMRTRLQRAVADQTANAPGAVWSPRLQQLLEQPEIKQGIRRGWNIERRRAIGEGRTFSPTEYAIIGFEKNGDPKIGEVPNMALLMTAKEGLDDILQSTKMRDPLTGRLNKNGASYAALREGLVNELDRLNPAYRAARNMWSGQSQSIDALRAGEALLGSRRFAQIEDAEKFYARLTDSDKEFFKIGVANDLKNRLYKNRTINNEDIKRRLRPLFKNEQEATDFIDALERERTMRRTWGNLRGLAQQPDPEHAASELALTAAHSLGNLMHGRYIRGALNAVRLRRLLGQRPNPELDLEIAKMLTNPDIALRGSQGPAIPRVGDRGPAGGTITSQYSVKRPSP